MKIHFDAVFKEHALPILKEERYLKMKDYPAHGNYSLYDHCFRVALLAYSIAKEKGYEVDVPSLIRGCLLHDYYLYNWHHKKEGHRFHGLRHPGFSYHKAKKDFSLSRKEKNMILSHMFPLTFWVFPKSKEAWLLTYADKVCANKEHKNTFQKEKKVQAFGFGLKKEAI